MSGLLSALRPWLLLLLAFAVPLQGVAAALGASPPGIAAAGMAGMPPIDRPVAQLAHHAHHAHDAHQAPEARAQGEEAPAARPAPMPHCAHGASLVSMKSGCGACCGAQASTTARLDVAPAPNRALRASRRPADEVGADFLTGRLERPPRAHLA